MEDYPNNYDQLLFYEWMMVACCIRCSAVSRFSDGWATVDFNSGRSIGQGYVVGVHCG